MANVFAWPPVGAIGSEWTEIAPLDESFSGATGKRYASSNQDIRREASLVASSLGRGRNGAGYMEMLKRLLVGGENYVRLTSYPINWHIDALTDPLARAQMPLEWTSGGAQMVWYGGGSAITWLAGSVITATSTDTSGDYPIITATGLPVSQLVARPGEFLTMFENDADLTGSTVQVLAPAFSDASGQAYIKVFSAPSFTTGRINIGQSDTAVFRVSGALPRSSQPVGGNWSYLWEFEEVKASQVGGFVENTDWFKAT